MTQKEFEEIMKEVPEEIKSLIPDFLKRRLLEIAQFSELLQKKDFQSLKVIGHKLKGNGASFGFQKITDLGHILEEAADTQNFEKTHQAAQQLTHYFKEIKPLVEAHFQGDL